MSETDVHDKRHRGACKESAPDWIRGPSCMALVITSAGKATSRALPHSAVATATVAPIVMTSGTARSAAFPAETRSWQSYSEVPQAGQQAIHPKERGVDELDFRFPGFMTQVMVAVSNERRLKLSSE